VVEGVTGSFFHDATPESLANVVRRLEHMRFDHAAIRRHAKGFDTEVFKEKLGEFVTQSVEKYTDGN
jgi:hypothetical protein